MGLWARERGGRDLLAEVCCSNIRFAGVLNYEVKFGTAVFP